MEIRIALSNPAFLLTVNNEVETTAADIIRGVDSSYGLQAECRKLAEELLATIGRV